MRPKALTTIFFFSSGMTRKDPQSSLTADPFVGSPYAYRRYPEGKCWLVLRSSLFPLYIRICFLVEMPHSSTSPLLAAFCLFDVRRNPLIPPPYVLSRVWTVSDFFIPTSASRRTLNLCVAVFFYLFLISPFKVIALFILPAESAQPVFPGQFVLNFKVVLLFPSRHRLSPLSLRDSKFTPSVPSRPLMMSAAGPWVH